MSDLAEIAWQIYCRETAGGLDVADYWEQLPPHVKAGYLNKAKEEQSMVGHYPEAGHLHIMESVAGKGFYAIGLYDKVVSPKKLRKAALLLLKLADKIEDADGT